MGHILVGQALVAGAVATFALSLAAAPAQADTGDALALVQGETGHVTRQVTGQVTGQAPGPALVRRVAVVAASAVAEVEAVRAKPAPRPAGTRTTPTRRTPGAARPRHEHSRRVHARHSVRRAVRHLLHGAATLGRPPADLESTDEGLDLSLPRGCRSASLDVGELRRCALAVSLGVTGGFRSGLLWYGVVLVGTGALLMARSSRAPARGAVSP